MTVTVRLDAEFEAKLERLARQRGTTKSQVIRQALEGLIRQEENPGASATSLYDRWAPFIGCVRGGDPERSSQTGKKFRRLLEQKKRRP